MSPENFVTSSRYNLLQILQQKYFDLELFVPCISQKTMDKFGGYLEQTDGCHAINKSNQKDVKSKTSSKIKQVGAKSWLESVSPVKLIS